MKDPQAACLATAVVLLTIASSASVATEPYDRDAALAVSQAAIGGTIGEYTLRDVRGQPFDLRQLQGRPLVVSMIYTSCHHVCPLITRSLAHTIQIAKEALGEDSFTVITVGFDWAVDTPDRMRVYATQQGVELPGWHFLAGDAATIARLSEDVGFRYFPSAKGFDHLAQTTIVDRDGKVYRQVYGQDNEALAIVEPLKELVFDTPRDAGLIEHWVDTFKLFCTVYDPNSGRYRFDYSIFMTIFVGFLSLGAIAVFIVSEWKRAR